MPAVGFQQLAAYAYSEGNDIGDPRDNYTDYDPYGGYQKKYDLQVLMMRVGPLAELVEDGNAWICRWI